METHSNPHPPSTNTLHTPMAQNVYNFPAFFAAYATLRRSQEGLAGAPEWPDLQSMVGSVAGDKVLDLGCGYGWFCRWAAENGAREALGLDVSRKMIKRAEGWEKREGVRAGYKVVDLDEWDGEEGRYDLVYSSLALHYVRDVRRVFGKIYDTLILGGRFVFSIEHPLFTAPLVPQCDEQKGSWELSSYHLEGERVRLWLGEEVRKQHRSLTTYMEGLLESGFRLEAFREWKPGEEQLREHPEWGMELHRPIFLLIGARKGA
jgi:SAM-dependent methyltransferase